MRKHLLMRKLLVNISMRMNRIEIAVSSKISGNMHEMYKIIYPNWMIRVMLKSL